jgi:hypothetical protein
MTAKLDKRFPAFKAELSALLHKYNVYFEEYDHEVYVNTRDPEDRFDGLPASIPLHDYNVLERSLFGCSTPRPDPPEFEELP